MHVYEVRPRKDHRGVDLIGVALPFSGLWYAGPDAVSNAVDYAKFRSRSHRAVIRVYDDAGNAIERHELHRRRLRLKFFEKLRLAVSVEGIEEKGHWVLKALAQRVGELAR